jgi:hypothetical protein
MKRVLQFSALLVCATATSWLLQSMVLASSDPHPIKELAAGEGIAAGTTLAAARTATFYPGGGSDSQAYGLAMLYTTITDANDSETGVMLSCRGYRGLGGTTAYVIPACPWDSTNLRYDCDDTAVSTIAYGAVQYWNPSDETAADTKSRVFRIDVEGFRKVDCSYRFTGGAAGDSIQVTIDLATKG